MISVAAVTAAELPDAGPGVRVVRARGLPEALASGAELLWLLHPGAVPAPDALPRLLEAMLDAPLATGLALDASGRPIDALTPRGKQLDVELLLLPDAGRRLPVRYASLANTLVRRDAIERRGGLRPDLGPWAEQEWTARLLAGGMAWLEPASVVTLSRGFRLRDPRLRDLPAAIRMTRTGAWSRGEVMRGFAAVTPRRGARR